MKLCPLLRKVEALIRLRDLTLMVAIVSASLAGTVHGFNMHQHGLTGTWYSPPARGQGIELEVYEDAFGPRMGLLFGSWATYPLGSETGQRWYTFEGIARSGQASATFVILQNTGGSFNAPPATQQVIIGTGRLAFVNCNTAVLEYEDLRLETENSGPYYLSGTLELVRLTPNVTCSVDGASGSDVDFSFSGHWFNPETPGQGVFIELNPIAEASFLVWYTYRTDGEFYGATGDGNRWYTAQGKFVPGVYTLPMTLYETTGGVFYASEDPVGSLDPGFTPVTYAVGTATVTFFDCDAAQLTFEFTSGFNHGESGTINLSRVGPAPCDSGAGEWDY